MENVKFSGQFREKTTVSVKEFTNLNDLISASSEADATIPPIHVEVASRNALNSLTKDLLLKYGKQVVKGHSFSCKLDKMGLALPLKDSEIKGIEEDEYPLIFTFNSLDDMAIFATAFEDAIPVKRVSSKISNTKQNAIRDMFTRKEKNILTIIASVFVACFAIFLFIQNSTSNKTINEERMRANGERMRASLERQHGFHLTGNYTEKEFLRIGSAINQGLDKNTIERGEFEALPEEIKKKMIESGDVSLFPELVVFSNGTKGSNARSMNNNKKKKEDYSWIIGMWYLETPYGITGIHFREGGRCTELDDVNNPYSVKYGNYEIRDDNTLAYTIDGEPITTTIEIVGERLHAGDGYYYKKIRE